MIFFFSVWLAFIAGWLAHTYFRPVPRALVEPEEDTSVTSINESPPFWPNRKRY